MSISSFFGSDKFLLALQWTITKCLTKLLSNLYFITQLVILFVSCDTLFRWNFKVIYNLFKYAYCQLSLQLSQKWSCIGKYALKYAKCNSRTHDLLGLEAPKSRIPSKPCTSFPPNQLNLCTMHAIKYWICGKHLWLSINKGLKVESKS